jgi:UDP-N-acetylglucosamine 1-carboxyvinyltransferase
MKKKIIVSGGVPLSGTVTISGMKNAALPIIFATVLVKGACIIHNLPNVSDITISLDILKTLGAHVEYLNEHSVKIDTQDLTVQDISDEITRKMRASYYLLGVELGRFGNAKIGYPGGCDFGVRPIDQHVKCMEKLGANVEIEGHSIQASAKDGLNGSTIFFDIVTVGATINAILAATLADGMTTIENAAKEPHIVDLANFLNTCGADIKGAGTDIIKVRGVKQLSGCTYTIIPDMIEAGTYMVAAAAAGGDVTVCNLIPKHMDAVTAKLEEIGITVEEGDDSIRIIRPTNCSLRSCSVKTQPYPGFPTDMQPQFGALLCNADGESTIHEGVWSKRFKYTEELKRMGAYITIDGDGKIARISGGKGCLHGASVRSCDLRGGAAMIVAALAANGVTDIEDIHYIERGYDNIVEKFQKLGAKIDVVSIPDIEI